MLKSTIKTMKKNNPDNPYVKQVSIPRLRKFQQLYPELLKEDH
jgi:peptide-methionine (S)-S-oxide reductase